MRKVNVLIALCLIATTPAWAVPIEYKYTTDTASPAGNVPELSALFTGFSVSGSFFYDPDTPLFLTNADGAELYLGAITGWTGTVGPYSFADSDGLGFVLSGDETFDVGPLPNGPFTPSDIFLLGMGAPGTGAAAGFSAGGFTLDNVRMFWIENLLPGVPDLISGSGLLDAIPGSGGRLALDFGTIQRGDLILPVNVFFDNLRVTRVPEPGSALLLLSGLLVLGLRKHIGRA